MTSLLSSIQRRPSCVDHQITCFVEIWHLWKCHLIPDSPVPNSRKMRKKPLGYYSQPFPQFIRAFLASVNIHIHANNSIGVPGSNCAWHQDILWTFQLYKLINSLLLLKPYGSLIIKSPNTFIQRRQWHPTPVLLPGKSYGWRSLVGCSPWGLLRVGHDWATSLSGIGEGNGNPLQCSCLENPRDGEPGGLPSMGWHRVRHDWSDLAAAAAETVVNMLIT